MAGSNIAPARDFADRDIMESRAQEKLCGALLMREFETIRTDAVAANSTKLWVGCFDLISAQSFSALRAGPEAMHWGGIVSRRFGMLHFL